MNKLFPVIHLVSYDQLCENIETCLKADVKQVFIINHLTNYNDLCFFANKARIAYPELWIGLNFLDLDPKTSLGLKLPYNGLWFDKSLTLDDVEGRLSVHSEIFDKTVNEVVFSGLNFKYQKQFSGEYLVEAIDLIKQTSTVACTSGPGTGKEASIVKIETLKGLLGDFPLALASGVSSKNVELFLPYVDMFLVASSITDRNEIINEDSLKELRDKIG